MSWGSHCGESPEFTWLIVSFRKKNGDLGEILPILRVMESESRSFFLKVSDLTAALDLLKFGHQTSSDMHWLCEITQRLADAESRRPVCVLSNQVYPMLSTSNLKTIQATFS